MNKTILLISSALVVMLLPGLAIAEDDPLLMLVKMLKDNGTIDQHSFEVLNTNIQARNQEVMELRQQLVTLKKNAKAEPQEREKPAPLELVKKDRLEVKSSDGDFAFRVGGRIYADAAFYDDDDTDLGSGTEMRAARLFMSGTLWHDWKFKGQYEFADNKTSIKDAYIKYVGFKPASITIGHFKEPISLENLTSSRFNTFMERALPNSVIKVPGDRAIGVAFNTHGDNWSAAAGTFGSSASNTSSDSGWGLTGRTTWAPLNGKTRALHLGLSGGYRWLDAHDTTLKFKSGNESHLTSSTPTTVTVSNADSLTRGVAEAALIYGPFSMQTEYMISHVNAPAGDQDMSGWYIEGSWFLTGESRNYKAKSGKFGRIKPHGIVGKGGIGAWQLAMRFSSLDLKDGATTGFEQDNMTVGLNWHTTPNLRFLANYVHVLDIDGGSYDGEEPGVFQLRGQVDF